MRKFSLKPPGSKSSSDTNPPKFDMRRQETVTGEPARTQWPWVNIIIGAAAVKNQALPKNTAAVLSAMRNPVSPGVEAAGDLNIMTRVPEPDPDWREPLPSPNAFGDGHGLIGGSARPINMQNQAPQGEQQ